MSLIREDWSSSWNMKTKNLGDFCKWENEEGNLLPMQKRDARKSYETSLKLFKIPAYQQPLLHKKIWALGSKDMNWRIYLKSSNPKDLEWLLLANPYIVTCCPSLRQSSFPELHKTVLQVWKQPGNVQTMCMWQ